MRNSKLLVQSINVHETMVSTMVSSFMAGKKFSGSICPGIPVIAIRLNC